MFNPSVTFSAFSALLFLRFLMRQVDDRVGR